jgi:hypothetical protein
MRESADVRSEDPRMKGRMIVLAGIKALFCMIALPSFGC